MLVRGPSPLLFVCGGVLFSRTRWGGVSSPLISLASRFGMGLGVSLSLCPPQNSVGPPLAPPLCWGVGWGGLLVFCVVVVHIPLPPGCGLPLHDFPLGWCVLFVVVVLAD